MKLIRLYADLRRNKRRRRCRECDLSGTSVRLDKNESQAIEGASTAGFIRLMTVGLAIVNAKNVTSARKREGHCVIGSRNDAALCVLHGDGDMSYIIRRGAEPLPIIHKR